MAILSNQGGIPGRRFHGSPALSEINVTPFVDVVLVLLIIFMLTAHVMESGIDVDVPTVKHVRETAKELPIVSVTKTGAIYLNRDEVNINNIGDLVRRKFGSEKSVYVMADKETPWDQVAQVVSTLSDAKLAISMVTKPEDQAGKRRK
ncbi:MAG: ExbD/TolR family protein [Bryobacteraceae bacterium]